MDFQEMQARARHVRSRYAEVETSAYGRSWTTEEIMLGFLGDVGDLAKLVQGKAGVRPHEITAPIVHATTLITNALTQSPVSPAAVPAAFLGTRSSECRPIIMIGP